MERAAKLHVSLGKLRPQCLGIRLRPKKPVDQVNVRPLLPVVRTVVVFEIALIEIKKVP
jgi:hypothetical protein